MSPESADRRYRIGFLNPYSTGQGGFQDMVWRSMVTAARRSGVSALVFAGGAIDEAPYNPHEKNLNIAYDLVLPEYLDGVIINNIIGAYVTAERFQEFCRSFGLPVVAIFGEVKGFPDVRVVNTQGMRDVILHLIKHHQYKHIAFIKGWESYPDAIERFEVYKETLRECGIPYDPELVFKGQFDMESGAKAVRHWMSLPDKPIDVIVASNDAMAYGAINVLRERGKRVPRDVAVTGFDDTDEAAYYTPPLTTVKQPFVDICLKAIDILRGIIEGKRDIESVTVPAYMIVRQSCGCISELVRDAETSGMEIPLPPGVRDSDNRTGRVEGLVQELMRIAPEHDAKLLPEIFSTFMDDVEEKRPGEFVRGLRSLFQVKIIRGQDIFPFQRCMFVLRTWIPSLWKDEQSIKRAESLILQASVLIGESSLQAAGYQKILVENKSKELREVGHELITTFNFDQLKNVIRGQLERLRVPSCYLSVFRDVNHQEAGSTAFLVLKEKKGAGDENRLQEDSLPAKPDRDFFPKDRRFAFAVHPLYFREHTLGFAIFEMGPEDGVVYDALQGQISSSLMGSELIRQRERTEEAEKRRGDRIQELVRPMLDSMGSVTNTAREKIGMIGNLIAATKENSEKLENTNKAIKSMNEKLGQMADVVGIIDEISARVNILAINTSIESAHAGEFGKGFAVIAGEIRKLADSIKNNAMVIANYLKDFRPTIDGSRKAGDESREAFRLLEKDVLGVADTLQGITASMEELSASSTQILTIMDNTAR
ncbi:MAG: substrate-binding domain-containing protein [Spirochaetales bacterium]|nr:substrate-binding domain-containing protein [Spirochaetales bacterium]